MHLLNESLNPESSVVFFAIFEVFSYLCSMKKKELIDGAEIIGLETGKAVSLPLYVTRGSGESVTVTMCPDPAVTLVQT